MKHTFSALMLLGAVLTAQAGAQATPGAVTLQASPAPVTSPVVSAAAPSPATLSPVTAPTTNPLTVTSLSTIRLSFDLQGQKYPAATYLVAQKPVGASSYQPGSSHLNGAALPDPLVGASGTLYWLLDAATLAQVTQQAGQQQTELSYQVTHTAPLPPLPQAALLVHDTRDSTASNTPAWQRLSGQADLSDYGGAVPLSAESPSENPGAIKLPLDGSQVRRSDQIGVVVEVPVGSDLTPTINGQPIAATQLGDSQTSADGQTERRHYYAVKIRPGVNTITLGNQQTTFRYAGATASYQLEPLSLIADGSTPIRVRIQALDADGILSEQPYLTVQSNLEPTQPDARPTETGYQIALKDGVGILELRPQTTPVALSVDLWRDTQVFHRTFEVQAGGAAVGVGMVSATLGLNGGLNGAGLSSDNLSIQARAYYEGPLAGGKVYLSADKNGLPRTEDVNNRNATFGDSSQQTVPLQGSDPVAFAYEHPRFRAAYRQSGLPVTAVPVTGQITALSASTRGNTRVSGFAAWLPSDLVSAQPLTPEGTRLLRLGRENLAPDSESLTVVTTDRDTGAELERRTLVRNVDYTLDPQTGIVTLAQALSRVDENLNPVTVLATYRLASSSQNRTLAYGAQVETGGENARVGAALVHMDGVTTYGVAGHYFTPDVQADARVLVAGGIHAEATASASWGPSNASRSTASLSAYHQDASYNGLGDQGEGTRFKAKLSAPLTDRVLALADADYTQSLSGRQGNIAAQALYKFKPLIVGAGAKYSFGDQQGVSLIGSVGYDDGKLVTLLTHSQPVSGNVSPVTDFKASYPLSRNLRIGLNDHYVWNEGHTTSVTLDSTVGRTNYAVGYDLPNAGGSGNRARFGVSTSLPLSSRTSLGLRGAYVRDLRASTSQLSGSADLMYSADHYVASLGTDLTYDTSLTSPLTTVVRAGISGDLSTHLNVSADTTLQFGQTPGTRIGLGYAYRNTALSSLGYLRYLDGSLAGSTPNLTTGISAEYRQPRLSVRGGVDARMLLQDRDSLTYQPYLGLSANVAQRLRLGAWGRALVQPATQTSIGGYGIEAGFQALPGTWLTAGYNLKGFDGIDTAGLYTRQGAYIRLDLTLDETLNGATK